MKSANREHQLGLVEKKIAPSKETQPEYMESEQDVLFILKVNMWEGMSKFIKFRIGNNPEELAYQFCEEHQLSTEIYDFICESLRQKLWQFNTGQLVDSKSKAVQTKKNPAQINKIAKVNRFTEAESLQQTYHDLETSPRDTRDELLMQKPRSSKKVATAINQQSAVEPTGKVSFHPTSWAIDERLATNLKALQTSAQVPKEKSNVVKKSNDQTAPATVEYPAKSDARSSTPDYIRSRLS